MSKYTTIRHTKWIDVPFTSRLSVSIAPALVFGTLLVKCVFLISLNSGVYLPAHYQALLLFFVVLVQVCWITHSSLCTYLFNLVNHSLMHFVIAKYDLFLLSAKLNDHELLTVFIFNFLSCNIFVGEFSSATPFCIAFFVKYDANSSFVLCKP